MKKIMATLFALIMVMSVIVASISASAANVCYNVSGDLTKTVSFNVDVGKKLLSSEKVVLTQTKGNTKQTYYGKQKTVGKYGCFYVSVYDNTAKKWVYSNKKWQNKTFTIKSSKLKKNHSYTVTVRGKFQKNVADGYDDFPYVFKQWLSYPKWTVTKTGNNVKLCY